MIAFICTRSNRHTLFSAHEHLQNDACFECGFTGKACLPAEFLLDTNQLIELRYAFAAATGTCFQMSCNAGSGIVSR
jgi:hypothetical protein